VVIGFDLKETGRKIRNKNKKVKNGSIKI